MFEVKEIIKTCGVCPAQWEGTLTDGRMIYVRLRHGWLSIRVSESPTDHIYDAVAGKEVYGTADVQYDGMMDYDELKTHARDQIRWCESET